VNIERTQFLGFGIVQRAALISREYVPQLDLIPGQRKAEAEVVRAERQLAHMARVRHGQKQVSTS
jgi:hypothetical protein